MVPAVRDTTAAAGRARIDAPYGLGEWPTLPLRPEERFPVLSSAGVWLLFLIWPLVAMLSGGAPWEQKVLGLAGMAGFVTLYIRHFIWPWRLQRWPHWANTVLVTGLMGLCVLATVPTAGLNAFNFLPFTLAVWIFPHAIRLGVPVAVGLTLAWAILGYSAGAESGAWWLIIPSSLALVIMVAMRVSMEHEEKGRALSEELALSRQREQVGRDVHDLLGHSLTVITLKTDLARRLVDADPERAKAELEEVLGLSRQSLAEVRNTVGGLHVPELGAQLASVRTALETAGISALLPEPDSVSELAADRRELYAWCLREAVTNVIRHADAAHCTVTIAADRLVVADDGVGLGACPAEGGTGAGPGTTPADSPAAAGSPVASGDRSAGTGLRGMLRRVEEAGGRLTVTETHPGRDRPGTTLEVHL
ncbi:sensor histidine kinase [Cellulosimicrobium funkei]|nr:sensor histidine kinase [Cellulosimicrobium funkei]